MQKKWKKAGSSLMLLFMMLALILTSFSLPAAAESLPPADKQAGQEVALASEAKSEEAAVSYPVDQLISLTEDKTGLSFQLPIEGKSLEEVNSLIQEKKIQLSLDRDPSRQYVDKKIFPNQKAGGPLDSWKTLKRNENGEYLPMFSNLQMTAEEKEGKVFLNITMDLSAYQPDHTVPHAEGGKYMASAAISSCRQRQRISCWARQMSRSFPMQSSIPWLKSMPSWISWPSLKADCMWRKNPWVSLPAGGICPTSLLLTVRNR